MRGANHSSGGVLQIVVYLSVISEPKRLGDLGPVGLSSHEQQKPCSTYSIALEDSCKLITSLLAESFGAVTSNMIKSRLN
jgi:hypothetical protein